MRVEHPEQSPPSKFIFLKQAVAPQKLGVSYAGYVIQTAKQKYENEKFRIVVSQKPNASNKSKQRG